ncbi:unnamed protein product [Mytilus coruscus]|uniref:Uncharacterized protein n=1 Tax=Mytilus coruscus TaxID=42192 RepID=A0A6J8DY95_MYTCO|nr:unnamed protein product [Mytilus coruscus]
MGSLVVVLVICLIISHVYCFLKRASKSRVTVEISPEEQYDEIGTVKYNDHIFEKMINVVDNNSDDTSRRADNSRSSFRVDAESSNDGSIIRQSGLTQFGDDYENPYQTIKSDNIEIHPYSSILSSNYQNTMIFPVRAGSKTPKSCRDDDNHWLVIYVKGK